MEHPYPPGTKVRVVDPGDNGVSVGDILTITGSILRANYIYQTDGPMLFDFRVVPVEEQKEEEMTFAVGDKVRITKDVEALREVYVGPDQAAGEIPGGTGVVEEVDTSKSHNNIRTPFRVLTKCTLYDGREHRFWLGEQHLTKLPKYEQIVGLVTEENETTETAAARELKEFREKVIGAARHLKGYVTDNETICEEGFKDRLRDIGIEDEIYPNYEPPVGSIVRHRFYSVAYVRQWGRGRDGELNWEETGQRDRVKWDDIKDDVVVILDTGGNSYVND